MAQIHFNRIYVIESLQDGETLTGTDLHKDLLRYQSIKHPDFQSVLSTPKNIIEWNQLFDQIKLDCKQNGISPIIHFEVHGSMNHDGLVLNSGDLITWEDLYQNLVPINIAIKNELFVTMAVCHGLFSMSSSFINRTAAFRGIIGSFEEIGMQDLVIRYFAFYEELFRSFDLNEAYQKLQESNPTLPSSYKCYSAEEIFALAYTEYLRNECSEENLLKRAKSISSDLPSLRTRRERRKWERDFIKKENKMREVYFKQDYETFFMLDKYPDLRDSIGLECDMPKLKEWLTR